MKSEERELLDGKPGTGLWAVMNMLGGMSGLLSIALIVWKGGVLYQHVDDHERRLAIMESGGSIGLREHVKQDDERVNELRLRVVHQEEVSASLLELKGDVKVLNVKMDSIKDQLNTSNNSNPNGKQRP
jgi:hypothetical protein